MGDDDPIDLVVQGQLVQMVHELEPRRVVHVLAADRRQLVAGDFGQVRQGRHGGDQVLDAEDAGRVAAGPVGRAGDGAAGGDDPDPRPGAHGLTPLP